MNGYDVTPTPPVNGHATFIRRNGRHSLNESSPSTNHSSSLLTIEQFPCTTNYSNSSSNIPNRQNDDDEDDEKDSNRQRYRPPSSSTNDSLFAPPVKPRKSVTTPTSLLVNSSKPQQNHHHHHHHHVVITANYPEDFDDEVNSLEGHGSESDFDDDQFLQHERPSSRLSSHNDDHLQSQSNTKLRRPHYKQGKQLNKNPTYDDYRFLDDQQQQSSSPNKSKQQTRPTTNKELPQPSSNRIGSGSGNQPTSNRLKSSSKSSSAESIPTLDLTVAGQKVFRTKQQADTYLSNSLPSPNAMRPPSGRLKPISSAKSASSYTDELSSSLSTKTLEDVTNNVKQSPPPSSTRTHLYKKRLAPLVNGSDGMIKKYSYRPSIDQQQYIVDDVPSDRSEETSVGTSNGGGGGGGSRDIKPSNGSDNRSKYH
jgi:hypothetical protein